MRKHRPGNLVRYSSAGQPAKYRWDFTNNGTFDTALNSNPTVTHNYPDEQKGYRAGACGRGAAW